MFAPITIPFGAKMLFNTATVKHNVAFENVELALAEMCNVVKDTYGGDKGGFIAGQVFEFSGFVSDEGSLSADKTAEKHIAIVTFWKSIEEHEKFSALGKLCVESKELGYDMLWQGEPELKV